MSTWEEIQEARLADVLELQKVHKRLLAAKEQGTAPDPADVEIARSVAATGYGGVDRINAPDEY
ncbi:hypothetical protein HPO96_28635 [Kribbella sandramycini]|uniref:Uncharacterized protein n=1 Tax=Kribbella sandramycini TaxID=60450 RepID=A0A7Y4L6S9_9ACTN|nr:hypothetical protein [Kribbella sandramycini]MBB6571575.1 hypothetical protein [Kribbella sandramycini]NOL44221.1 hypothetical protein [Kribbella sandramycini]